MQRSVDTEEEGGSEPQPLANKQANVADKLILPE